MLGNRSRVCGWCGIRYPDFKVGIRFADVRRELGRNGAPLEHSSGRRWITRHTVLGRMHQYKLDFWREYHGPGRCEPRATGPAGDPSDLANLPDLPF